MELDRGLSLRLEMMGDSQDLLPGVGGCTRTINGYICLSALETLPQDEFHRSCPLDTPAGLRLRDYPPNFPLFRSKDD